MMGLFGWDLPPGCTMRDLEMAYGAEVPCECCGAWPDDCQCPECPVCGVYGDKRCYVEHGLRFSEAQLIGMRRAEAEAQQAAEADRHLAEDLEIEWRD